MFFKSCSRKPQRNSEERQVGDPNGRVISTEGNLLSLYYIVLLYWVKGIKNVGTHKEKINSTGYSSLGRERKGN